MKITISIPTDKAQKVMDAFGHIFPCPKDDKGKDLYTPAAWIKKKLKEFIIDVVQRYEKRQAISKIKIDENLIAVT